MNREPLKSGDLCLIIGGYHGDIPRCSCATGRAIVTLDYPVSLANGDGGRDEGWALKRPYYRCTTQNGEVNGCSTKYLLKISGPEAHGHDVGDVLATPGKSLAEA